MDQKHELEIIVTDRDIDLVGHVNNIVYLKWVQDVAESHWLAVSTPQEQQSFFWVVARHEIDYKRPTFKEDVVIAITWVGSKIGNMFERHTDLLRKSDRKLLAQIRSLWCPVDLVTKRPIELDVDLIQRMTKK